MNLVLNVSTHPGDLALLDEWRRKIAAQKLALSLP